MKKILCLALLVLVFLATGICTAKVPDLIGKWTGSYNGEVSGSAKLPENKSLNVTVVEQKNRLFTGNLAYKLDNGTEVVEGFAGAIGSDNKAFYIAEFRDGYDLGTIISEDVIELIYLHDGKMGNVEIDRLHRIKV